MNEIENNEDIKKRNNYERIIGEILGAFSKLEFHIIVESTIHKKIIPINKEDEKDKLLLDDIYTIVNTLATQYNRTPITFDLYKSLLKPPKPKSFRSNEVGIFADKIIPSFFDKNRNIVKIITSFERLSLNGYPDEKITDKYGRVTYLEVKTTTRRDVGSPRDFFFSPLTNSKRKIENDGHHLLLCFDTYEQKEKEFIITGWCLIDLFDIKVSMKPEFNTNNLELYKKENILLEVNLINKK
ncbi:MAG: hypothetical protein CVT88_07625 [Candidatus Altiarchaeales archaeon HGW-Altiarchaeales-1]|nr:MAG: hypothetical protein CVT88_07625 [Candidatus Altiarchaeales archaeon HGW-Altiarchaeales-1]PKP59748.1 MAG: hypothetical protein CVT89_00860 [Candidatus Altiarchaeales archaeon HGW-Altiarchaeales-2]